MGTGFKTVSLLTLLAFVFMAYVAVNSPKLPVAGLKIQIDGEFEVSSLSVAAILMILYNLFAWVQLVQKVKNSNHLGDNPVELERLK